MASSSSTSDENEMDAYCGFTPSQEEELFNNPHVSSPESSVSPLSPNPTPPYFDGNAIHICTAPDTAPSGIASSPSSDQFETPPDEPRRSVSEELASPDGGESYGSEIGKKQVRVSGESSAKANTPCVAATEAQIGGTENMDLETEVTEEGKNVIGTGKSVNNGVKLASRAGKEAKMADKEEASDNVAIVLEALKWVADEQRLNTNDDCGATGDIFETAKKFGMVFPEPEWWKDLKKD